MKGGDNMAELTLTIDNFDDEVIKSDLPVLVDFWAEWCGPCKMLSPIISDIANKYEGKVKVGKVNVTDEPGLANHFEVLGIPFVAIFKDGKIVKSSVGYRPIEQIESLLNI